MNLLSSHLTDVFLPVIYSVLPWTSKDQKLSLRPLYGYTRKGSSIGMFKSDLCFDASYRIPVLKNPWKQEYTRKKKKRNIVLFYFCSHIVERKHI